MSLVLGLRSLSLNALFLRCLKTTLESMLDFIVNACLHREEVPEIGAILVISYHFYFINFNLISINRQKCLVCFRLNLHHIIWGSLILQLLVVYVNILPASNISLRTFIGCAVREFTFLAKKPGCKGLRVSTDACWGRCETWEKPVLDPPYIDGHHRVCTYNETRFITVKLPNCRPGIDPYYTYPVAVRCDCGVCSTATTECETL
ncbi:glycoprotein hormone beta-5 [Scyliorhinus torazame]|uniref:glycoprotein hormone beta-5 n=1 Tax=Scyliorhinus torazame TaxID=75743 RepID=UPI003B5ADE2A